MINQPNLITAEEFSGLSLSSQKEISRNIWDNLPLNKKICLISIDLTKDKSKLEQSIEKLKGSISAVCTDSSKYHISYIPSNEELIRLPDTIKEEFIKDNDLDDNWKIKFTNNLLKSLKFFPEDIINAVRLSTVHLTE